MATVQTFTKSMIERYLRACNMKFMIDGDGDYKVEFAYDQEMGCELTIYLMTGGSKKDVYGVLALSDKRYSKDAWVKATLLCNQWNKEKRWPKAYLYYNDLNDPYATIRLEQHIDLETGIHQELFDDFTGTMLVGASAFWKWIRSYDM